MCRNDPPGWPVLIGYSRQAALATWRRRKSMVSGWCARTCTHFTARRHDVDDGRRMSIIATLIESRDGDEQTTEVEVCASSIIHRSLSARERSACVQSMLIGRNRVTRPISKRYVSGPIVAYV